MKNIIKKNRGLVLLVLMLAFSLHINAVFEGRDKSLEQYQSIRNQVELSELNQPKAFINPDDNNGGKPQGPALGDPVPVSDSLWPFLMLGGIACSMYVFKKNKVKMVKKKFEVL